MAKILIIDDEKGICEEFREILQEEGYEVDIAHNGAEGVEKIAANEYALVFLDVLMPKMEGREVFEKIKKIKKVPVAIMSGFLPANKEKDVLALGAVACLKKPLDLEQVHKLLGDLNLK